MFTFPNSISLSRLFVFWVPFIDEPKRPLLASSFQVSDKAFALESKDETH